MSDRDNDTLFTVPSAPSGSWEQLIANEQAWIEFIRVISCGSDPRVTPTRIRALAAITVPLNAAFGIALPGPITKFDWRHHAWVITLIDLPFSVSPVVAGLLFVLIFGANSALGAWLVASGFPIVFAVPGIVPTTLFMTFPFVARELTPVMAEQGRAEEEAALTLGASAWRTFFTVTLPNIRWALICGVLLCNARAMDEFGAVAVASGKDVMV